MTSTNLLNSPLTINIPGSGPVYSSAPSFNFGISSYSNRTSKPATTSRMIKLLGERFSFSSESPISLNVGDDVTESLLGTQTESKAEERPSGSDIKGNSADVVMNRSSSDEKESSLGNSSSREAQLSSESPVPAPTSESPSWKQLYSDPWKCLSPKLLILHRRRCIPASMYHTSTHSIPQPDHQQDPFVDMEKGLPPRFNSISDSRSTNLAPILLVLFTLLFAIVNLLVLDPSFLPTACAHLSTYAT